MGMTQQPGAVCARRGSHRMVAWVQKGLFDSDRAVTWQNAPIGVHSATMKIVGAELAREEAGTFTIKIECADAFASKLGSYRIGCLKGFCAGLATYGLPRKTCQGRWPNHQAPL
jgi:hypothetical protein